MTAIGLDVGGSRLRAGLVLVEEGAIIARHAASLGEDKSPARVVEAIASAVEGFGVPGVPLGIGFAAIFRGRDGLVANSPNHGWRDVPLGRLLADRLGRPFVLENDLTMITWGEQRFGGGHGVADVACVYVGTGVGSGAVVGGRLLRGATHSAPEVGHVKVVPGGALCGCGQRGCLEAYVGGRTLGESPDWARAGALLGLALGNLVTTLNPARLVMGGSVWLGQPELRARTHETIRETALEAALAAVTVVDTEIGDDAGVLGAADLAAIGG